jgi:Kdo2-lipid IVA lauroyltransferase/acyltransferase
MYYFVYGLLWLVSLIPFRVMYWLADFIYLLVYYVFRYRKPIVMSNLQIAFPEKTETERIKIARAFYKNFIDTFLESIKFITISRKQILKRSSGEFELINRLAARGLNIHIMAGHQFNWEFGNLLYSMNLKIPFTGVYMPINNKILDKIFYKFRGQFGTKLISAHEFKTQIREVYSTQYALALAADQNPGHPGNAYWMRFFSKLTPFITGPARGAVKNNTAVVIVGFQKIKRGHYHFYTSLITEEAGLYTPQQLTLLYKNELEKIIRRDPSNYLWSHRRWKYDWKPEYGNIVE